jgi:glycosyltransferase involved in cell wall biosynthesis
MASDQVVAKTLDVVSATDLPRITVVTPSFNQARYLERTIRSVLEQGYPNLEYMVLDAASADGSLEIIERYADRLDYWRSEPDDGQSAAINEGWKRASGEVISWLGSDDYYLPGTLHWVGEYFRDHPEEWVIYGSWEAVDEAGRRLNYAGSRFRRRTLILSRNTIPQPSAFIRREAIDTVGLLDERLHYTMDLDLFLRIAEHRTPRFVSRPLAAATMHPEAKTFSQRDAMARERYEVRLRYARGIEVPLVLLQPVQSKLFHALPPFARGLVNAIRPRRKFARPARQRR